MITVDDVVRSILTAIFSNEKTRDVLLLKGGQALRLAHGITNRLSQDADFSVARSFDERDPFFAELAKSLIAEFRKHKLHLFDYEIVRKPKVRSKETPDFWSGWRIEFKLIEANRARLKEEQRRREALIPRGSQSSKMRLEISEFEYCDVFDVVKIGSVRVKVYPPSLMIVEKVRAICQQHPEYQLRKKAGNRARDYYDIERIYETIIRKKKKAAFIQEAREELPKVFAAKQVPTTLLTKIFEPSFVRFQESAWKSVEQTVEGRLESFDFYNQVLKTVVQEITP